MLAAVSKATGRPLYSLHKVLYHKSPAKRGFVSALELKRRQKQNLQNISRIKTKRFKKQLFKNIGPDLSYGYVSSLGQIWII